MRDSITAYPDKARVSARPIIWAAVPFVAGVLLAAELPAAAPALIPSAAIMGLILLGMGRRHRRAALAAVVLLFASAGGLRWHVSDSSAPGDPLSRIAAVRPADTLYRLEGTVSEAGLLLPESDYVQFVLRVAEAGVADTAEAVEGGVLVRWTDPDHPVFPGDRVEVQGRLELDLGRINPDTGSVEDFYRRKDVHTALRLRGANQVARLSGGSWWDVRVLAGQFRHFLAQRLDRVVPESSMPFLLTVWLGERGLLEDTAYRRFLHSGAAHILAVSGLHTGIVYVTLAGFLRFVTPRRKLRAVLCIAGVFFFALMAGARISSLRAAVMIGLYLSADLARREPDAVNALSVSALLFLVIDPDLIYDAGFQLSFLSVASLLLFSPLIASRMPALPAGIREFVAAPVAVQILPLPIAAAHFHVVPLAAVATNLLVIPLLTVVLWLAFLTSCLAIVSLPVAQLFGHALDTPPVQFIQALTAYIADLPFSHIRLTVPTVLAIGLYWLAAALAFHGLTRDRFSGRWLAGSAITLVAAVAAWSPITQPAEVTFLDVGHGDAIFVRTPAGGTMLVDGGDRTGFLDMGERVVAPFLWANHVRRVDALVTTHDDRDHFGGQAYIVRNFRVGALYIGEMPDRSAELMELLDMCTQHGVPVRVVAGGGRIPLRGAAVDVLHPPEPWLESASDNDRSLVLRVEWPGISTLLTGDIEGPAESALAPGLAPVQVLKVPHHGSDTSSSPEFVAAAAPNLAVISTGRFWGGSVLDEGVLGRYAARGIRTLRTDIHGGIRLRFTAGALRAYTARGTRGYPVRATAASVR